MSDVFNEENIVEQNTFMQNSGFVTFEEIIDESELDFSKLTSSKIDNTNYFGVSKEQIKQFNKDSDGDDGSKLSRIIAKSKSLKEYLKDDTNYISEFQDKWQKPDEGALKKIKGKVETAQKKIAWFDKLYSSFTKYTKWSLLICLICPFAIPAMLSVLLVTAGGMATHEFLSQREYMKAVSGLTINGQNPYKNLHYKKGFKKVMELYPEDILNKKLNDAKNEKDRKSAMQNLIDYNVEQALKKEREIAGDKQVESEQISNNSDEIKSIEENKIEEVIAPTVAETNERGSDAVVSFKSESEPENPDNIKDEKEMPKGPNDPELGSAN